ncbi:MAG: DUF3048 domain-containing protein [Chloroflexi bacterium]|nr:DUF3048 domain-containing protein [Chloroflexota bacterium]
MDSKLARLSVITVILLAACTPAAPPSTPTPTRTPRPTFTAIPATPTPDPNICPLTGEHIPDPALGQRRPIIVKIGNDSRSWPQSGIYKADIVVEHLAEGGITRFDAVYLCQGFSAIGPVRSARLVDVPLSYIFDGILVHVGASGGVLWILEHETNFPRLNDWRGDPGFYLAEGRVRPYSTFTGTARVWEIAEDRGWQKSMQVPPLHFGALDPLVLHQEASEVTIPYFFNNRVTWEWDVGSSKYLRSVNGSPLLEAATGEQFSATNVLILWAEHKPADPPVIEDENNQLSLEINLWSRGDAVLLRDGYLISGQWAWDGPGTRLSLFDSNGNPLPLAVGKTWVQIVPLTLEIETD